jgi:hypothetical protein
MVSSRQMSESRQITTRVRSRLVMPGGGDFAYLSEARAVGICAGMRMSSFSTDAVSVVSILGLSLEAVLVDSK